MIITGHLGVAGAGEELTLVPGGLRIEHGRVVETFDLQRGPAPDLGGHGRVILPGFIDTHLHLPQFDSIGVHGRTLLDWLERVIFPAEARWADAAFAGSMGERVADQLLRFGTTGVCAYGTVHEAGTLAAHRALAARGLRGYLGQVLMDRHAPPELTRPADELLAQAARAETIGRIDPVITPRFAVSCTEPLLRGAAELSARTGRRVQTHLAETREEGALVSRLFGGLEYSEVYQRAGLLRPGAIMAHGIHLGAGARAALASAGAVVAHCPTANLFLQSGAMDLAGLRGAGVRIALGSDVAGGHERSMVRVAQSMIETATRAAMDTPVTPIPSAAHAWWQITRGNALALGMTDGGEIAANAAADLLVIHPTIRWMESPDPLGALLWAWDDRWIEAVIVNGRPASG